MREGELVLVRDLSCARGHWPLARVEKVNISEDGRVRSVRLRLGNRNLDGLGKAMEAPRMLDRPIHEVVRLRLG